MSFILSAYLEREGMTLIETDFEHLEIMLRKM